MGCTGPALTSSLWLKPGSPSTGGDIQVWDTNDKRIVSGAVFLDHTVQVRDATTGYNTYIYHGYSAQINVLAWSSDSSRIVLAGLDGIVQVWQAK